MRFESVVREARRNVTSGTTRAVMLATVLTLLGLAAVASEAAAIGALEHEAREFQTSGGSILTVVSPGAVDGVRCESLASVPGVRAAGALTVLPGERVTAVALPGAPLARGLATAGFPKVVRAESDGGPGLVLSGEAVRTLGAVVGGPLRTTKGVTRVAGAFEYPRDGRRDGYGYLAVETVGAAAMFDECWVDAWPQSPALRSLALTVLRAGASASDVPPEVAPLNVTHGVEFSGHRRYSDRLTRWAGVVVGALAAVVGFVALRARRVELASALHDRVARVDLWAVVFVETLAWTAAPVLLTVAATTIVLGSHGEVLVGLVLGVRIATLLAAGAMVGVAAALATTRERHLFLYAKDR